MFGLESIPEVSFRGNLTRQLAKTAMQMLYGNDCLPFREEENEKRLLFDEIHAECKKNNYGSYLSWTESEFVHTFPLSGTEFAKESISRVPDFLLEFADSSNTGEIKAKYPKIFNYYLQHVVPDLESALKEGQSNP